MSEEEEVVSPRYLLLQGNSYQNLTLRLLLRPEFGGLLNYCENSLPGTPSFEFPIFIEEQNPTPNPEIPKKNTLTRTFSKSSRELLAPSL